VLLGGETEGLRRMHEFLAQKSRVATFDKPKTSPVVSLASAGQADTTLLAPYLKFGCVSVRSLYEGLVKTVSGRKHTEPPVSLIGQVLWREHFYFMSFTYPSFDSQDGNELVLSAEWDDDEVLFQAWADGKTGFPWIDAIMRQLRTEGWIHHLARHCAACFLTRGDLWQNWERGAAVFDKYLLDADWALNNANWMWLSGTSVMFTTYFRVYSPTAFPVKYGAAAREYVRYWVPEVRDVEDEFLFEPWRSKKMSKIDYPAPIVNHREALEINMERMKASYASKIRGSSRPGPAVMQSSCASSGKFPSSWLENKQGNNSASRSGTATKLHQSPAKKPSRKRAGSQDLDEDTARQRKTPRTEETQAQS
jgi:cryptochrome